MAESNTNTGVYQIGEVARRSGVSVRTVRFYEQKGLLETPQRTSGGMRLFDDRDVSRVKLVRRLRNVGLDLEEIRDVMVSDGVDRSERVDHTLEVLRLEAERSRQRIAELHRESEEREALISLVSQCVTCDVADCPAECPPQQHVI
ncbi:MAG: MerR family transcriptional regulator [Dehalogenimonas sp.]|uniref:MerR family transcriptional regulator n=1 Tax=Candidatus Dehalogenimonas loeffleri TaxID=3127115 RepID=A0ABZ2J7N7_9CHLR|nr:MerR family transcriptional regulator [Dehalogenimonas sp.]